MKPFLTKPLHSVANVNILISISDGFFIPAFSKVALTSFEKYNQKKWRTFLYKIKRCIIIRF